LIVNEIASYRRLNLARSRDQLKANAERISQNQQVFIGDFLEIEDYSYRTPVQFMVSSSDYLDIRSQVAVIQPVPQFNQNLDDAQNSSPQKENSKLNFDKKLTQIVLELFPMNPHEASSRDVWSYITLRVLPEHAMWRYPNRSDKPEWERYIGLERNTFKRIWWRAYMIGSDLAAQMDEDELVQMFERTESIGSNKKLMRSMARFALESRDAMKAIGGKSSSLIAETAKSLRRSMAVISYESMTDSEIDTYVRTHAMGALERIRSSRET